jgi:hypothetical protein
VFLVLDFIDFNPKIINELLSLSINPNSKFQTDLMKKIIVIFKLVIIQITMTVGLFCSGVSLFSFFAQIVLWLKTSHWVSLPLMYIFVDPWNELKSLYPFAEILKNSMDPFSDPFVIIRFSGKFRFLWSSFSDWLVSPNAWIGFHSIIEYLFRAIPFWLAVFLFGLAIAIPCNNYIESLREKK